MTQPNTSPNASQPLDAAALSSLKAKLETARFNKIALFQPYLKQQEFFDLGAFKRERLLMAGNQLGKTECGAVEAVYHLTGEYPVGWLGRKFKTPVRMWIAGVTAKDVRDVAQTKLLGKPGVTEEFGTGYIPKSKIVDVSLARGVTDAYDTIQVRHKSGGISTATFKSYDAGREKFQGEPVDIIWLDEEPPFEIYMECITRTNATKGMVYMTFTPLQGMSAVVLRFLDEVAPDRSVVNMTIEDALHYTPAERAAIIASYPAHMRDARTKGVPILGSGRIFQYSDEQVTELDLTYVPEHWYKLWAVDFGIDHPFAAVLMAEDRDADVIHILKTIRVKGTLPISHAAAMRAIAANVPVAWPQDGTQRQTDGKSLAATYKSHNLKMLPMHATWPEGGLSTEKGILEMEERFSTRRLVVAASLGDWLGEFRLYHRKDGKIVKLQDDLMSATRVGVMMRRYGRQLPIVGGGMLGVRPAARREPRMADGVDFDVFG